MINHSTNHNSNSCAKIPGATFGIFAICASTISFSNMLPFRCRLGGDKTGVKIMPLPCFGDDVGSALPNSIQWHLCCLARYPLGELQ